MRFVIRLLGSDEWSTAELAVRIYLSVKTNHSSIRETLSDMLVELGDKTEKLFVKIVKSRKNSVCHIPHVVNMLSDIKIRIRLVKWLIDYIDDRVEHKDIIDDSEKDRKYYEALLSKAISHIRSKK